MHIHFPLVLGASNSFLEVNLSLKLNRSYHSYIDKTIR